VSGERGPHGAVGGGGPKPSRILLIGFMGAGKTSVGRSLARALGWRFVDFDDAIVAEEGRTVAAIFRDSGEPHFRGVEARVGQALLAQREVVLASGGGWAAEPGRLDEVPSGTETFWLRVSPSEALRRASRDPGKRPLLAVESPEERIARLLEEREPAYARAGSVVDTDGRTVEDVTTEILRILAGTYPAVTRTEAE